MVGYFYFRHAGHIQQSLRLKNIFIKGGADFLIMNKQYEFNFLKKFHDLFFGNQVEGIVRYIIIFKMREIYFIQRKWKIVPGKPSRSPFA